MIRLNTQHSTWSIDLGGGAALHLRPIQPADVQVARGIAATFSKDSEDAERNSLYRAVLAQTLLLRLLQSWDGIGDAEGAPIDVARDEAGNLLPATKEAVSALLSLASVFSAVEDALTIPLFLQAAEKNASSPSLNGTSPGASKVEQAPAAGEPIAGNA